MNETRKFSLALLVHTHWLQDIHILPLPTPILSSAQPPNTRVLRALSVHIPPAPAVDSPPLAGFVIPPVRLSPFSLPLRGIFNRILTGLFGISKKRLVILKFDWV